MVAKNPAPKEKGPGPVQASEMETFHLELEPSDVDSQIIDLIEVIEDEISAKGEGFSGPDESPENDGEETDLFETIELEEAFSIETTESDTTKIPPAATVGGVGAERPRREVPEQGPTEGFTGQPEEDSGERPAALQDLDTHRLLAELFASGDSDPSQRRKEKERSADASEAELAPTVEEDLFSELLEDLESTERDVVQEAGEVQPPPRAEGALQDHELHEVDWVRSGSYYPQLIVSLDRRIAERQQEMEKEIRELKIQREQLKQNFEEVRSLLYAKEDELRKALVRVFTTFWKLRVSELDVTKETLCRENLLVEHNGRKIVFKIRSTSTAKPSTKFITQLWQDLHYSGLGASTEGGLILNHDVRVEPKYRGLAYTGDDEEYLEDIIFIDTRVLYDLTLAIIDYGLPVQEATELLLRKGRVKFRLDDVAA